MLINFPNQLTSEEEQLLKKIAKMKKKKKVFIEKKAQIKESQTDSTNLSFSATAAAALKLKRSSAIISRLKKIGLNLRITTPTISNETLINKSNFTANSGNYSGSQLDAKEQAKKLVQSGLIKLESENKEKGFKRSCSRKDDTKKTNISLTQDPFDSSSKITYSSINSPNAVKSPSVSSNYFGANSNKFSFPNQDNLNQQSNQYGQSPNYSNNNQRGGYRKNNSFQNNNFNQDRNNRFQNNRPNQQQQQAGVSLFVKANNVTEELLRSIFNANVANAKVLSIDIKTNFAFVSVDTTESANNAILELNGKTFQENVYSVSLARPRKTFNRTNTYNSNFDRSNSTNSNNANNNNNNPNSFNATNSAMSSPSTNDPNRQIINYEDI